MMTMKYLDSYNGHEIKVLCEGVHLYDATKIGYEESQDKEDIHGLGKADRNKDPDEAPQEDTVIGTKRGVKKYTLSLEILEKNKAVLEEGLDAERSGSEILTTTTVGSQKVNSLMDLRELTVVIQYPEINGLRRRAKFLGVEFTKISGDIAPGEAPGKKLSAKASSAKGLL